MSKQKTITLTDEHARMGKLSNNLENHGDEKVPAFTLPFTVMLTHEQLDKLMGRYFHRSLFNREKDLWQPVDGFRRCNPLALTDHYEKAVARITVHGDRSVEFHDCKVDKLSLAPQTGGLTELRFQIYLRPGLGDENLLLQEYQAREVALEVTGKLAAKKNPQQDKLPLGSPDDKPSEADQRMLDRAEALKGKCDVCKTVDTIKDICPQCFWHSAEDRNATPEEIEAAGIELLNGTDRKPPARAPIPGAH